MEYDTYEKLRNLRRALHQCPEKSGEEWETMEVLKDFIKNHTKAKELITLHVEKNMKI